MHLVHDATQRLEGSHAHGVPLVCGQWEQLRDKLLAHAVQARTQGGCETHRVVMLHLDVW